jgi:hypothetical protein
VFVAGRGIQGTVWGVLIDEQNRMSLSRLQMFLWTAVVLSALVTITTHNVWTAGSLDQIQHALAIGVPQELWLAMGLSITSLVGSPLILSTKKESPPSKAEAARTKQQVVRQQRVELSDVGHQGSVLVKAGPSDARIGDLFRGDETGNAARLDLGKVQLFYFTLILVFAYAAALVGSLSAVSGQLKALPTLDASMLALLAISHAGYLANKAAPHSAPGGGV